MPSIEGEIEFSAYCSRCGKGYMIHEGHACDDIPVGKVRMATEEETKEFDKRHNTDLLSDEEILIKFTIDELEETLEFYEDYTDSCLCHVRSSLSKLREAKKQYYEKD